MKKLFGVWDEGLLNYSVNPRFRAPRTVAGLNALKVVKEIDNIDLHSKSNILFLFWSFKYRFLKRVCGIIAILANRLIAANVCLNYK